MNIVPFPPGFRSATKEELAAVRKIITAAHSTEVLTEIQYWIQCDAAHEVVASMTVSQLIRHMEMVHQKPGTPGYL